MPLNGGGCIVHLRSPSEWPQNVPPDRSRLVDKGGLDDALAVCLLRLLHPPLCLHDCKVGREIP